MQDEAAIGVVGVGWVGLVTAACFAELGHQVVARDIVEEKVESLRRGEVTIHEPEIAELLERNASRLTFTTSMDELLDRSRLLFVCVDTPPTASGDADLSRVRAVVGELPDDSDHVLIMKSTVPAGTGKAIRRDRPELSYVSCPEFLKEGSAVHDFMHPDRVVIGADSGDEIAARDVAALYEPLGGEIVRTDVASAEMIKLGSNAFLATKISFINEIANVSEEVGADVTEVARGMGLDDRIGPAFLRAGIGYGGSCFVGEETVLVRYLGAVRLLSFEDLWELVRENSAAEDRDAIEPEDLWAWSWMPGERQAEWMPVTVLTKRPYNGELVEVRTKMGRRVTVTADHPFIVGDGRDDRILTRVLASELTEDDWLPLASGCGSSADPDRLTPERAIGGHIPSDEALVSVGEGVQSALHEPAPGDPAKALAHPRNHIAFHRAPAALPVVGRNGREPRIPDETWDELPDRKRALLCGLWEAGGSASNASDGSSVVLDFETISERLADCVARLLGDLGIVASWRRGRSKQSTKETHRLRISGADQVEKALFLVPERDRLGVKTALGRQSKRIAPTGFRRFEAGSLPWVRVTGIARKQAEAPVYSLEVTGSHTVVTGGGLVVSNCFPKDVTALKQLAGNSGYHFQLLTAVIEVNELQKRRVIGKLERHLGSLAGRRIALLGLAFKPNTDDMRQASSIVLAARLQGEGAEVVAYDPVAREEAAPEMPGVEMTESATAAIEGADAVVLVTEWEEFARLDWDEAARLAANPLIVDGRNYLDPAKMARAGFTYEGIGRIGDREVEPVPAATGGPVGAERAGPPARPRSAHGDE